MRVGDVRTTRWVVVVAVVAVVPCVPERRLCEAFASGTGVGAACAFGLAGVGVACSIEEFVDSPS